MSHKFTVGEYTTRDGRKALVACVRENAPYPLIGWIEDCEGAETWSAYGQIVLAEENSGDLMPPAPEMARVPLCADDIPQGAEFRPRGEPWRMCWNWLDADGISLARRGFVSYDLLFREYEMRPIGGEWVPCWKEVAK